MAWFVHVSALTGVAAQDMSLRLALLLGNQNSPNLSKHEWDMTEMLCFVKPPLVKPHLAHDFIPVPCSSVAWLPQTAKPQRETEFSTKGLEWPSLSMLSICRNGCQKDSILYSTLDSAVKTCKWEIWQNKRCPASPAVQKMLLSGLVFPMLMLCNSASPKIKLMYKDTYFICTITFPHSLLSRAKKLQYILKFHFVKRVGG